MKTDLTTRITSKMDGFSKGQRRIANYILENYDTAAYMTAFALGQTVGVSESTVVRFAMMLGFEGYPQLQRAVQELVRSKLTSVQRVEVTRARMKDEEVLQSVLSYDIANISKTLEELSPEAFDKAVNSLVSARRVFVFGAGSCRALANFFAHYLRLLLPDVRYISTSSEAEMLEEMFSINENDTFVALSYPRYSSKAVKAVHFAHSRGATVVSLTDSELSPIAELANCLLLAHSDMATIVDSLVAPMSVINALLVAISLRRIEENRSVLTEMEALWETYHEYQPK